MYTVRTKTYASLLRKNYEAKVPLMVYGGPGIGKSEIPRQVFQAVASEEKKDFIEWAHATLDEKLNMIENPDKYFVFCDQRISQMDVTDLRGIPNMTRGDMLETIPMSWIVYFTQPEAHGVIFFDEINLAAPVVAGSAYQIINDRCVADRKLGDNVYLIAAGNRLSDKAYVHSMPAPLKDRFAELEVTHDVEDWTNWAYGKVNPHLISFIQWKPSYLYRGMDGKGEDKPSTPRGVVRASNLIAGLKLEDEDTKKGGVGSTEVHQLISIGCGESFATEFRAYVKHFQSLNWNKIFAHPETVSEFEFDKLWAVAGGLGEQFHRKPKDIELFDKILSVVQNMHVDFAVVTLRMLRGDGDATKNFKAIIKKSKIFKKMAKDFGKFIID